MLLQMRQAEMQAALSLVRRESAPIHRKVLEALKGNAEAILRQLSVDVQNSLLTNAKQSVSSQTANQ